MQAGFDAWFFYGIAGINPDLSAPGFKKIILKPQLTAQLDWAKGSYNSVHGKIVSDWKKVAGKFIWNVEIPVGSTAQIVLPKEFSKITIYDGGGKIWKQNLSAGNYDFGSGKYKIEAY
jgi:alpha-L-rhamnosidase